MIYIGQALSLRVRPRSGPPLRLVADFERPVLAGDAAIQLADTGT